MNLAFDFIVDKENHSITIKREFAAERSLVWDAYTKAELLDQWWAPKPWKAKTKIMDFREGGYWLYAMVGPRGEEHWGIANYVKIRSHEYYSGFDAFANAEGHINPDMPQAKWEVTFIDKGSLIFIEMHTTYPDLAQLEATIQMGFKEGITMAMKGLDELLTSLEN